MNAPFTQQQAAQEMNWSDYVSYDRDTGIFTRTVDSGRFPKGSKTGGRSGTAYVMIRVKGASILAHRLAWFMETGVWPPECVDHINGDPSDNRFCNLRLASRAENQQNISSRSRALSGLKGAFWSKAQKKWISSISAKGKKYHLGCFSTPEQAHEAYLNAKERLHTFNPGLRGLGE